MPQVRFRVASCSSLQQAFFHSRFCEHSHHYRRREGTVDKSAGTTRRVSASGMDLFDSQQSRFRSLRYFTFLSRIQPSLHLCRLRRVMSTTTRAYLLSPDTKEISMSRLWSRLTHLGRSSTTSLLRLLLQKDRRWRSHLEIRSLILQHHGQKAGGAVSHH